MTRCAKCSRRQRPGCHLCAIFDCALRWETDRLLAAAERAVRT